MLKAKVSMKAIQERLGHSKMSTTGDLYLQVLRDMGVDTAEAFQRQFDDVRWQKRRSGPSNSQFSFESQRSSVVEQRFRNAVTALQMLLFPPVQRHFVADAFCFGSQNPD